MYFLQLNCLYWLWDLKARNEIGEHGTQESVSTHDTPRQMLYSNPQKKAPFSLALSV